MNSFIKRNQKKLLAVFSAGLMIAFSLPSALSSKDRALTVGYAGRTAVTNKDLAASHADWDLLKKTLSREDMDPNTGRTSRNGVLAHYLYPQVSAVLDANPELFHLLVMEADKMGTVVSNDEVQQVWKNFEHFDDNSGSYEERAKEAIRNLLLVANAADRAADAVKISRPLRDQTLANEEEISLNLVEFKPADYLDKVPAWTADEKAAKVKAQFEAYKNFEPTTRPVNDFSFGYRIPNRVRVQYVEVPGDAVRKAVAAKMEADKNDVGVEARKYYRQNLDRFPAPFGARPPVGVAATQPAKLKALSKTFTQRPPATGPTTAPAASSFEEYRDEIVERIAKDRAGKLTADIVTYVSSTMVTDFGAFKGALTAGAGNPTTGPSIAPALLEAVPVSSLGVRYDSYEYLQKLAASAEAKFGVRPVTQQDMALRTEKQLADDESIAGAAVQGTTMMEFFQQLQQAGEDMQTAFRRGQQLNQAYGPLGKFAAYATHFVAALAGPDSLAAAKSYRPLRVLSLYEPSPILHGSGGSFGQSEHTDLFIFRAAAADPAHAPELKEIEGQVLADARFVEAFKLASEDAMKFVNNATRLNSHLDSVAPAARKTVVPTGLFSRRQASIPGYQPASGNAAPVFVDLAYTLLHRGQPHAISVLDFRPAGVTLAAELNQVKPTWTADEFAMNQLEIARSAERSNANNLKLQWFSPQDIVARMHYLPTSTKTGANR